MNERAMSNTTTWNLTVFAHSSSIYMEYKEYYIPQSTFWFFKISNFINKEGFIIYPALVEDWSIRAFRMNFTKELYLSNSLVIQGHEHTAVIFDWSANHVIDEALTGWGRLEAEEGSQAPVFLHNYSIHVQETGDVCALRGDGNRQRGEKHPCRHPLHFLLSKILSHLSREVVETVKGTGMEERIPRFPEHSWNLVVIVCHQLRFGGLLRQGKKTVDVFHCFESFLREGEKKELNIKGARCGWKVPKMECLSYTPARVPCLWHYPAGPDAFPSAWTDFLGCLG